MALPCGSRSAAAAAASMGASERTTSTTRLCGSRLSRVSDAVGRGVAHQHRAAAVVDALHDPAQLARGVRGARIAVVVAVIRSVVVVVVAERVVIAAEADGEADVEMREETEARLGDEE